MNMSISNLASALVTLAVARNRKMRLETPFAFIIMRVKRDHRRGRGKEGPWLPDGNSQILRSYVFGPSGLRNYGSAMLRYKFDPFLGLRPSTLHPWRNPRKGRDQILQRSIAEP